MPTPDLWTIQDVAQHIGASSTGSARRTLSRWGIRATQHHIDDHGRAHSLYNPEEVRNARDSRPGRSRRA